MRNIRLADTFREGHVYSIEGKKYPQVYLSCYNPEEKIDHREKTESQKEDLLLSHLI
jgi:hypothetical protein